MQHSQSVKGNVQKMSEAETSDLEYPRADLEETNPPERMIRSLHEARQCKNVND